jgi:hypothetical protein
MARENITPITNKSLFIFGTARHLVGQTLAQDAGRTEDLLCGTVIGYNPVTEKWVPFADDAVDGSLRNVGIYDGPSIAAADIVAGDVVLGKVLIGSDAEVAEDMVVYDGDDLYSFDTAYGAGADATTLRHALYERGIYLKTAELFTKE